MLLFDADWATKANENCNILIILVLLFMKSIVTKLYLLVIVGGLFSIFIYNELNIPCEA